MNRDHLLTGPRAWSYAEIAGELSRLLGRPIRHEALDEQQLTERLAESTPPAFAALLASLDAAIADGAEDRTTDAVELLTGRAPHGLTEHLSSHLSELRSDRSA